MIKDNDGVDIGAVGTVDLLQNVNLSTQPVSALDWSPDKVKLFCTLGGKFDNKCNFTFIYI